MKRIKVALTALCLLMASSALQAQSLKMPAPSPTQTLKQNFGLGDISIEYSRPLVRGRVIFGDLVPYGKIWRTGANAATKISFSEDVTFGGQAVKAGTYALYTIPGKTNWTIMLYKDLNLGGNVAQYNNENEVVRIQQKVHYNERSIESFTIALAKVKSNTAVLEISWDDVRIPIKIATEIDTKIMKNIDEVMHKDSKPYYQAANYYYESGKDLNQAKIWVDKAVEQNPKAFWVRLLKAKIELKLKQNKAAIQSANEVIELATEAQNDDYVKMAKKLKAEAGQQ